jgi:hypothetical protein
MAHRYTEYLLCIYIAVPFGPDVFISAARILVSTNPITAIPNAQKNKLWQTVRPKRLVETRPWHLFCILPSAVKLAFAQGNTGNI